MSEVAVALLLVVFGVIVLVFYMLPAIIAGFRDHRNSLAILFLNLVSGWTAIGWIACFIWACVGSKKKFMGSGSEIEY